MRRRCKVMSLFYGVGTSVLAGAGTAVPAALPPVVHADMETATNVPFSAALDAAGRFRLSLSCLTTPVTPAEIAAGFRAPADGATPTYRRARYLKMGRSGPRSIPGTAGRTAT